MKVVVIGGTGLVGSKVVAKLRRQGREAVAASPNTGVNTITGEGLADALRGAAVVVDVSNSPSFEDAAVLEFFETSTRNIVEADAAAEIGHLVALSIVGAEGLPDSGYLQAKVAQEKLVRGSSIPYSIVRATQFFEFVKGIADGSTYGGIVRLPSVLWQPIAADDVAAAVTTVTLGAPLDDVIEGEVSTARDRPRVRRRLVHALEFVGGGRRHAIRAALLTKAADDGVFGHRGPASSARYPAIRQ